MTQCEGIVAYRTSTIGYHPYHRPCSSESQIVCPKCNVNYCKRCFFNGLRHKCIKEEYGSQFRGIKGSMIRGIDWECCTQCAQRKPIENFAITLIKPVCQKCVDKNTFPMVSWVNYPKMPI